MLPTLQLPIPFTPVDHHLPSLFLLRGFTVPHSFAVKARVPPGPVDGNTFHLLQELTAAILFYLLSVLANQDGIVLVEWVFKVADMVEMDGGSAQPFHSKRVRCFPVNTVHPFGSRRVRGWR